MQVVFAHWIMCALMTTIVICLLECKFSVVFSGCVMIPWGVSCWDMDISRDLLRNFDEKTPMGQLRTEALIVEK